MKKVLLCVNHFREIRGSELVTLELAEYFLKIGWHATVYTNLFMPPIADEVFKLNQNKRLHVTADPYEILPADYDLIWIQHNLMPPNLIDALWRRGLRTSIVWHHMSPIIHIEMAILSDLENKLADAVTSVSKETADLLVDFGIERRKLKIFDNPAPDYFSSSIKPPKRNLDLSRVLVVSNHPPEEISAAAEELALRDIQVTFVGDMHGVKRVSPEVLMRHDAIITIGKTVQYALTMGIPCYVYDHYGGPGWLTSSNFAREAAYNFSGRASRQKKDPMEIAKELIHNFPSAAKYVTDNKSDFVKQWKLSNQMDRLFSSLPPAPSLKTLSKAEALKFAAFCELHRGLYRTLEYYKDNYVKKET